MRREFTTTPGSHQSQWPDSVAYREAIQSPSLVLGDGQLAGAEVSLDRQGLPLAYTGRFAVVFRLKTFDGADWALRCFTSPADPLGLPRAVRYRILASRIATIKDIVVPFRFIERGIRVLGQWYPAIAMQWARGRPLGRWVEENLSRPEMLRQLARTLTGLLERLEGEGLAHGDWQHDNLLVDQDGRRVTLVDYDGMFVPELAGYPSPELGHPNYQHPARSEKHYGPGLDRFSCLVMQTALLALARDPTLWARYGDGESLLFRAADLRNPDSSRLFSELRALAERERDAELAESIARLADALRAGPDSTLLPAVATTPPAPIDLAKLSAPEGWVEPLQPLPTEVVATPTVRWWQEGQTETAQSAMQPVAVPTASHASTVQEEECLERRHLWSQRAVLAVLLFFAAHRLFYAGHSPKEIFAVITLLLWLGVALTGGYANWPQRRAHLLLDKRREKMLKQIHTRQIEMERLQGMADLAVLRAARGTLDDFIAEKLARLDVNRILGDGRISAATLDAVKAEGIKTALELRGRTNLVAVPPYQITLLQNWCQEREAELADEWRRLVAQSRTAEVDIQRLELEIASFEEEIVRIEQERESLPAATLPNYLRRLIQLVP